MIFRPTAMGTIGEWERKKERRREKGEKRDKRNTEKRVRKRSIGGKRKTER